MVLIDSQFVVVSSHMITPFTLLVLSTQYLASPIDAYCLTLSIIRVKNLEPVVDVPVGSVVTALSFAKLLDVDGYQEVYRSLDDGANWQIIGTNKVS
ncbi:MAG: hypothetical protein ACT4N5_00500 [Nitrosopumilaceae archaeon]